ncbi:MAG: NADP-dependent oxidoreductase [Candidatus Poribacteria bacterium]|nr:NADP-dependent oxidoreductase [Candidatus Poribacteria bacterium]
MANLVSRQIHLKNRIVGMPKEEDFEVVEVPLPEPDDGEVLVKNIYTSVDPYMRGGMRSAELGKPLGGGCVGKIVLSNSGKFKVGDYVTGYSGWRDHYIASAESLTSIDTTIAPLQSFLGAVGMPGRTAYFGLLEIGQPKEGETVFVSAAAGAVGSIVCQIAKIKGCRVVASAGSDEKVTWLIEKAGVDAAFNYKKVENLEAELRKHCPDGLDIYFENVGGKHLQAALAVMNMHGRIPLCGMISQYNDIEPTPGPTNLSSAIGKRIKLQGFIVTDFMARNNEFYRDMQQWISEEKITWEETIIEGLENASKAFIALFTGEKLGKIIVKVDTDF